MKKKKLHKKSKSVKFAVQSLISVPSHLHKTVVTIPNQVYDTLEEYRVRYTKYKTFTKFISTLFKFYSINPGYYNLKPTDVAYYNSFKTSKRNNASFYLNQEDSFKLQVMADQNLRSFTSESQWFIFSLFHYYRNFIFEDLYKLAV